MLNFRSMGRQLEMHYKSFCTKFMAYLPKLNLTRRPGYDIEHYRLKTSIYVISPQKMMTPRHTSIPLIIIPIKTGSTATLKQRSFSLLKLLF